MNEAIEDTQRVKQYESALVQIRSGLLARLDHLQSQYPEAVRARLGCQAWPLRPLFLKRERLEEVARNLSGVLIAAKERMQERGAATLNVPQEWPDRVNLAEGLKSRHLLSLARPDGFFSGGLYTVSELNVGSGLLATLCYTEILHAVLSNCPAFGAAGWQPEQLDRPLLSFFRTLGLTAGMKVALLVPKAEWEFIYDWERSMYLQVFRQHHLVVDFVFAEQLEFVRGSHYDLILQVTSGESHLTDPRELTLNPWLTGPSIVHPAACLLFDKGLLPWLAEQDLTRQAESVRFPECFYPQAEHAERLRLNKDAFVLKKAWIGKNTVIGCATHGRAWNRAVADAIDSNQFIAQEYVPLPEVEMPYLVDGEILKIPVNFEVSPFLVDGQYAGGFVRYAPARQGVLLSPSPSDVGMTLVLAC